MEIFAMRHALKPQLILGEADIGSIVLHPHLRAYISIKSASVQELGAFLDEMERSVGAVICSISTNALTSWVEIPILLW